MIETIQETNPNKHIEGLWDRSTNSEVINRLQAQEDAQSIVDENCSPEKFEVVEICCSDGRCNHNGKEFSVPGSGVFYSDEDFEKMLHDNPQITTLTWHFDCGAMKLAHDQAKEDGVLPEGIDSAEAFAEHWVKERAEKYGLKYRYIGPEQFVEPYHHERGIVFDATGSFHPVTVTGMPNVFVSSTPSVADSSMVATEAKVLTGIAFSDHGFGPYLSQQNPFYVMVAAKTQDEKQKFVHAISRSLEEFGDKVKVTGFIPPVV